MLARSVILALTCAMTVSALPLNINLGAFSPAFVVGDGEISLDGENAGELMETLETGAAASAEAEGITGEASVEGAVNAAIANAQAQASADAAAQQAEKEKNGKIEKRPNVVRRGEAPQDAPKKHKKNKRDLAGFRTALNFANIAQKNQPEVELGTPESGVGIIVRPGLNVPADSAAAGESGTLGKRDVEENVAEAPEAKRDDGKMGITLLAITEM